jgi:predicted RNA-binding Zn-ribbon protein involved in translation (DUF1610 family)
MVTGPACQRPVELRTALKVPAGVPIPGEKVRREVTTMATVRASCPECGDVEMSIRQVRVEVCRTTDVSTYSFQCPGCAVRVCKPAAPHVVDTLVAAGVSPVTWELPAELAEPKSGPPISHDDLLAFHFALADDAWLSRTLERARLTARSDREAA